MVPQNASHSSHRNSEVLISGAIAGVVSRTLTAPLERLKVLRQTANKSFYGKSIISSFKYMKQIEGWCGFFKGNGANVIRVIPFSAFEFFTYDFIRHQIFEGAPLTTRSALGIGAITAIISTTLTYPLDLVRTLFTLQIGNKQYKGIIKTLFKLYKNEGYRGWYRGCMMSLIGIVPFVSIKMATYNMTKQCFYEEHEKTPFRISAVLGLFASTVAVTLTYPTDLIKRMLQMRSLEGVEKYEDITDCVKRIYEEEGFLGFYKGLVACYLKVIPSVTIAFAVNNYCKDIFGITISAANGKEIKNSY